MLLTTKVLIKWNSRNKSYYVNLGYEFTKMGEAFEVKVKDLTKGANTRVDVQCDYCGQISSVSWNSYCHLKEKDNNSDCCNSPDCTGQKAKESMILLHGVDCSTKIPEVKEKINNTNLRKYGCKNPFGNKDIQQKIRDTNLKKYGVKVPTQNPQIKEKAKKTCLKKYGVENYGKIYSESHKKENSSCWKGGVSYHRVERSTYEYRHWRKDIFDRDLYTCQCCGARNGHGKYVQLEAHHIQNWKTNIELRYSCK